MMKKQRKKHENSGMSVGGNKLELSSYCNICEIMSVGTSKAHVSGLLVEKPRTILG